MKVELKESLELVKALELLAVKGKVILKGGVGAEDIAPALDLIKDINLLIEGFKGVEGVVAEVKDLEQEEIIQLGLALFGAYKKVKEA